VGVARLLAEPFLEGTLVAAAAEGAGLAYVPAGFRLGRGLDLDVAVAVVRHEADIAPTDR
jgi:hypothetical protein